MIHFYSSQSLDTLAPKLAEKLAHFQQQNDPFYAPWIIVQNKETETWLHTKLASANSISAHLDFILPNQFVFKLYRQVDEQLPKILPTDRVPLQWLILSLFKDKSQEFSRFGLHIPEQISAKIALAAEIADVFDLYQIYRPEMLSNWSSRPYDPQFDDWQVATWQLITQRLKIEFPNIPLRSDIPFKLIDSFNNHAFNIPNEIFISGISHWNKTFNKLIAALSDNCDIHWFQQTLEVPEWLAEASTDWVKPQIEVKQDLIQTLKEEGIEFKAHSIPILITNSKENNDWLTIHSCHNPKREVEVLHQAILSGLDHNPQISAQDMLIMVPDLEDYLPHIQAIFNDPASDIRLPIQTQSQRKGKPDEVFLKLLNYFAEGEKITQFLDVISSGPVKEHFSISNDLLVYVEHWFEEMHIHNGLRESDSDYSIEKGIHQLYEGLVLNNPPFKLFNNHVPFALPLQSDSFELVSKLHQVYRSFEKMKASARGDKTISEWLELAYLWSSDFFTDASGLKKLFTKLQDEVSYSACNLKLTFIEFKNWVAEHLAASSATSTPFGTGIQISSYIPYRNIPFKFIAILGLNEGVFPRNPKRPYFDKLHQHPQPGDRITKNDDQLLFLERLLSTQHHVHLSYLGEGELGGLVSPIVQQLMGAGNELKVQAHKLHAFDEFVEPESAVYASINTQIASKIDSSIKNKWKPVQDLSPVKDEEEIQLSDLISFYTDPAKFICTNQLGVKNVYDDDLLSDRQLFKVDGLQKYKLREQIEATFPKKTVDELRPFLKISGELPKGNLSEKSLFKEYEKIEKMKGIINEKFPDISDSDHIKTRIDKYVISGSITGINNQTLVKNQLSSVKGKHIIRLWIEFLAAQISLDVRNAELYAFEKDDMMCHRFYPVDNPIQHLKDLIEHFKKTPFEIEDSCVLPNLSWEYVRSEKDEHQKMKRLNDLWEGSPYLSGLKDNYFNQLLFGDEKPPLHERFKVFSEWFYRPIAEHWAEVKL